MKIEELSVKGFRSLYDVIWRPGDLNVLIGPNASGKSNLLRALDLISRAAHGDLGDYVQHEGGMGSIVWDGTVPDVKVQLLISSAHVQDVPSEVVLDYQFQLGRMGNTSAYRVVKEALDGTPAEELPDLRGAFPMLRRDIRGAFVGGARTLLLGLRPETIDEEECLLSAFTGPLANDPDLSTCAEYLQQFDAFQYFPTHRDAPIRQATIARVERRLAPDGQNLVSVLHTLYTGDREFKQAVNSAMEAAFGGEFEEIVFPPAADQRVQMRIRWRSLKRETSAADLSDGTLRFLFLITALANPYPPSLIAIDEPEIGLHPGMLPIIAEYSRQAATRTQVIFTTHSPEFLDAFGDEPPTTTITTLEEGKTHLKVLSDDALRYWLKEYTLGRMFRSGELEDLE